MIMVTHRLSRIREFDRAAVLSGGVLVEYGAPEELLEKSEGALTRLCEAAGGSGGGSGNESPTA